ncbi:AMIN domain-containing protein [Sulfurimonas sp.]|uniref:AMIN domain-containing protein n=1 Tax=Sulfurimonas sp. TaxID=2022749 RepID=UPI0025DD211D|nr:AMIN domain-containing protein [Sulfurimonas sp.]MBW6489193.1 AMIN domain-containing protein [Sulfurimonas sp.]
MIRALFISTLLLCTLHARENPFFPSIGEKDIPVTTNEQSEQTPLKRATITLPTQARVLQKVTIEFKNLDGSVENKSVELDNSVDWHLPIFISQSYAETTNSIKPETAPVTPVVPVVQKKSTPKTKEAKFENIVSIPFLKISSSSKSLKLTTSDEAIRNFLLVNPHRIVIDFKKETDMKSYIKKVEGNIFKRVRIGNHDGYYRVVVELDGHYRYDFKKVADGYFVELK